MERASDLIWGKTRCNKQALMCIVRGCRLNTTRYITCIRALYWRLDFTFSLIAFTKQGVFCSEKNSNKATRPSVYGIVVFA